MSVQQARRMEGEGAEIRPPAPAIPAAPQAAVVRMLRPVEGSAEELSPQAARRLQVLRYAQLLSMLHVRGVALRRELGAVWRMGRADPARLEPNLKRLRAILGEASLDAEQFAGYCPPMRGRVEGVRSKIEHASAAGLLDKLVRGEMFRAEAFEVERASGVLLTALCGAIGNDASPKVFPKLHAMAEQDGAGSLAAEIGQVCRRIPALAPGRQEEAIEVVRASLRAARRDWPSFERDRIDLALDRTFPTDPIKASSGPEPVLRAPAPKNTAMASTAKANPYAAALAAKPRSRDSQAQR